MALWACEGPAGPPGPGGPSGSQGPMGPSGPQGQGGSSGPQGPTGASGSEGPTGSTGATGATGPAGPAPDGGVDGRNAYLSAAGLLLEVLSAEVDAQGARATVRITDGNGVPLDVDGRYTLGTVSVRFVLAWLDQDASGQPRSYTAYTRRDQISPITMVTANQPSQDRDGTLEVLSWQDGIYEYTFGTDVPLDHADRTHTVAAWATRSLDGVEYVSNDTFDFVPSGGAVSVQRQFVTTNACNRCHGELSAHGGSRREVALCITCHEPSASDPDTGNTVNFPDMIHRIHAGHLLPSVEAGTPYVIIGRNQVPHDYSNVAFPGDITHCTTCHDGPQSNAWSERITRATCTGCHDRTSFELTPPAGFTPHSGGAWGDAACYDCHSANSAVADVVSRHTAPLRAATATRVALVITAVDGATPGGTLSVTFTATVNDQPRDLVASPLSRLAVTVSGPTTDYATYDNVVIQATSGAVGTLTHLGNGSHRYDFPTGRGIPSGSEGTFAVGLEGYVQASSTAPRYAAQNPVFYVGVTDSTAAPRRRVVETARCNGCHDALSAHGGTRREVDYCVMCHIPGNTGDERAPRIEGESVDVQSVGFKWMIHRIHRGEHLENGFTLGGFPLPTTTNPGGTPVDFGEVRFPNDMRRCTACHVEEPDLPLPGGVLPTVEETLRCTEDGGVDTNAYCDVRETVARREIPPESAACLSCHDSTAAAVHAEVMRTSAGESCSVCHARGSVYGLDVVHQLPP